jgi:hypothetical protein
MNSIRILAILILLAGCFGNSDGFNDLGTREESEDLTVANVFSSVNCIGVERGINIFGSRNSWNEWLAEQNTYLPSSPREVTTEDSIDEPSDFVIVISMGRQPTAGYNISLISSEASLSQGVLRVEINWKIPDQNAFLPQVITHPCIALLVPSSNIESIRILDQDHQILFEEQSAL